MRTSSHHLSILQCTNSNIIGTSLEINRGNYGISKKQHL
jgi:hypothetical protein